MTASVRMAQDRSHMTERMLNLTLEIIYLLTGESFPPVESGGQVTITMPSTRSHKLEGENDKRILEVIKKMMELLTGEVPIRCQDVAVYLSMEEWEYLEGHKDLYKDVMMEDEPDGSRKRNPPQRCPRPRDSTQKDLSISHHDEQKYLEGQKDLYKDVMMEDEPDGSRKRNPPQRCPRPLDSTPEDPTILHHDQEEDLPIPHHDEQKYLEGHKDLYEDITQEEHNALHHDQVHETEQYVNLYKDINMKPPHTQPERCALPLDSWDSIQEDPTIPRHDQDNSLNDIPVEIKQEVEDVHENDYLLSNEEVGLTVKLKEEESSPDEVTDVGSSSESYLLFPPLYNDVAECSSGIQNGPQNSHPGLYQEKETTNSLSPRQPVDEFFSFPLRDPSSVLGIDGPSHSSDLNGPPNHIGQRDEKTFPLYEADKFFISNASRAFDERRHNHELPFPCSECGKSFAQMGELLRHLTSHTAERPYSYPKSDRSFFGKPDFLPFQRVDTAEPSFSFSQCLKNLAQKRDLLAHQGTSLDERPFSCLECGKGYTQKAALMSHQRKHTGERPFSCVECGKCFVEKGHLLRHQKRHTTDRPFPCLECGKCFFQKEELATHQRSHTGERPFSCLECGKCFTQRGVLIAHQRSHVGARPYCCSECGRGFTVKGHLVTHQRIHTGERPFSCLLCGKRFIRKEHLVKHEKSRICLIPKSRVTQMAS